jgi:Flp pilus assembly protein TadD
MPISRTEITDEKRLRRTLLIGLLLAVVTLTLYWPVQSFDFVNFDDDIYVTDNRQVRGGLSTDGLQWAFTTFHAGNWHPLTWISHMADVEAYGLDAGGHHRTNALIHAAAALLLFFVLSAMTNSPWASALASCLFAIHPLHVESVAWVAERKDVLSGFFWILTMGAYYRYVNHPTIERYLWVLLSFGLGLLSKPMIVTLPFVLLLLDYWPLKRFAGARTAFDPWVYAGGTAGRAGLQCLVVEKVPLLFLAAASCIVTFIAQRGVGALWSLEKMPFEHRLANALVAYMEYIRKMLWPVDLSVLYPHAGMPTAWQTTLAVLLIASLSYVAVRKAREMPFLLVGWLWYLGTLVPVIGIIQVGSQSMADRYTYLPLVGLFIVVAWGAKSLVEKRPFLHHVVNAFFLVALAGLLMPARVQVETWRNSVTLFEQALRTTEVNPLAHHNIGAYYLERNECQKAVPYFLMALEAKKDYPYALSNLAVCTSRGNNPERALHLFEKAIRIDPRFTKARIDRGNYLMQLGRLEEAGKDFSEILIMKPDHEGAHTNLGLIFVQQGKLGDAEAHLLEALRVNPRNAEALNNLGLVFTEQGKSEEAIASFLKAREFAPGNTVIEKNLKTASGKPKKDTPGKGSI